MRVLAAAILVLALCAACSVKGMDRGFRTGYRRNFATSCAEGLQRRATWAYANAYCTCVAFGLTDRFDAGKLEALNFHVAPAPIKAESDKILRACAVKADKVASALEAPRLLPRSRDPCMTDATVTKPVSPDFPRSARDLMVPVQTEVEVQIDPRGSLQRAWIYKSSGRSDIDAEALKAARASTYSPKLVRCHPVTSRYLFRADFDPTR